MIVANPGLAEHMDLIFAEQRAHGFGKPDISDVASACMIAAKAGLARDLVADLLGAPSAELEVSATVVEVRS